MNEITKAILNILSLYPTLTSEDIAQLLPSFLPTRKKRIDARTVSRLLTALKREGLVEGEKKLVSKYRRYKLTIWRLNDGN